MSNPIVHPALTLLTVDRWDDAFAALHHASEELLGQARAQTLLDALGERGSIRDAIADTVDELYGHGRIISGEFALAWSMMTCSPSKPASLYSVLPQLTLALDEANLDAGADADVRDRLRIWWRAAMGEFSGAKMSMFALAKAVLQDTYQPEPVVEKPTLETVASWFSAPFAGPTMVVMPRERSSKLNNHNKIFAELVDKPMPLVAARDIDGARKRLGYEFPHAIGALTALFRDLREGMPVKIKSTILVGPMGAGKSRIVRRFLQEIGIQFTYRYDGGASSDNQFAGTSKAWSNTEACVPARAILQSRTANPVIMVDEIDKASTHTHNGRLWNALLPFLEAETAARYRDISLDAEIDLSAVSFICTANDVTVLPEVLRDRFRIVRVPAPRLVDLPLLAASVMADLSKEEEERAWDHPLATDELMVIAKAWERAGFSLRKLQKIVRATMEARDDNAMRH